MGDDILQSQGGIKRAAPEISDAGVAVMCDIARAAGLDLDDNKRQVLARLIEDGLVERKEPDRKGDDAAYAVTALGQRLLDQRGVGVNES